MYKLVQNIRRQRLHQYERHQRRKFESSFFAGMHVLCSSRMLYFELEPDRASVSENLTWVLCDVRINSEVPPGGPVELRSGQDAGHEAALIGEYQNQHQVDPVPLTD